MHYFRTEEENNNKSAYKTSGTTSIQNTTPKPTYVSLTWEGLWIVSRKNEPTTRERDTMRYKLQ